MSQPLVCQCHLSHWAPSTLTCTKREKPGPLQNLTLITCQQNSAQFSNSATEGKSEKKLDEKESGGSPFCSSKWVHSTLSLLPAAFKSSGFLKTHSWMPIPSQAFRVHPCQACGFLLYQSHQVSNHRGCCRWEAVSLCSLPSAVPNAYTLPCPPCGWWWWWWLFLLL